MPYETILTDLTDNIFTITINRPDKLNALNTQMIRDLIDAFDQADADEAVRAGSCLEHEKRKPALSENPTDGPF